MKFLSIFLIIFGLIVIIYPQFLAYLIGSFFIFVGLNMLVLTIWISRGKSEWWDEFFRVWKYIIYKK